MTDLPPYSHTPVTTSDGLTVVGWSSPVPVVAAHAPYWNERLQADYCTACGEDWPCLPWRQANPRCKCSHGKSNHTRGEGQCWLRSCGCATYRPQETT